jgi:hypothetical protein
LLVKVEFELILSGGQLKALANYILIASLGVGAKSKKQNAD